VDYELAKMEKKAQLDAGSVTAAGPVGAKKCKKNFILLIIGYFSALYLIS